MSLVRFWQTFCYAGQTVPTIESRHAWSRHCRACRTLCHCRIWHKILTYWVETMVVNTCTSFLKADNINIHHIIWRNRHIQEPPQDQPRKQVTDKQHQWLKHVWKFVDCHGHLPHHDTLWIEKVLCLHGCPVRCNQDSTHWAFEIRPWVASFLGTWRESLSFCEGVS